jgi:hypothetical protein
MKISIRLLVISILLIAPLSDAASNIGGKFEINSATAWYAKSLIYEDALSENDPVESNIKPKDGKIFIIVSAQISIDWPESDGITQYKINTRGIKLKSSNAEYSPIGHYRKGGRYSDWLPSSMFAQRERDFPYYLDLVFCVNQNDSNYEFLIENVNSPLALKDGPHESSTFDAEFRIIDSEFIHELTAGNIPKRASSDCSMTLKPVTGTLLKLTVEFSAKTPSADTESGLYTNGSITLQSKHVGIMIPDFGFIPAVAIVEKEMTFTGNCKIMVGFRKGLPNAPRTMTKTFLFCVPEQVPSVSFLYKNNVMIKDYRIEPIK